MKKVIRAVMVGLVSMCLILGILNIPTTTRQGIDGKLYVHSLPLYLKVFEFLDRDHAYRALVREITAGSKTDEEKVSRLYDWVRQNIHPVPEGFKVYDDHTLNIIIRQYGAADQAADVFTTLTFYAGFPSFFRDEFAPGRTDKPVACSYVLFDNKWHVFDAYRGAAFRNKSGHLASIEEIRRDPSIVLETSKTVLVVPYEAVFAGLQPVKKDFASKAEKQNPLARLRFEMRSVLNSRP